MRRRIRRKMLQGRTNATIVQPSIHSGRPATLPSATAMWRSSKALLPPRIMSIEKQDNHQLVRRTTSAAPPCTPSTTSVIPMGCEKEPPSFRSSLPSKAQIELEMRPRRGRPHLELTSMSPYLSIDLSFLLLNPDRPHIGAPTTMYMYIR